MAFWLAIFGTVIAAALALWLKALAGRRSWDESSRTAETARENLEKLGIHSGD